MQQSPDPSEYMGLRALLLTRVSTPTQEEMYGHTWQEMQIREKLIEPLGLRLDEERHIIRDTYSGLDYRYREALDTILDMAQRQEFDVLCMEVLDRGLGRKALAREIYRMQLKELGIRILTTDPSDHADDDSLEGLVMRFMRGYKAEEEVKDFVRRARGGKRAKATGTKEKGIPARIVGTGQRIYGYTYVLDGKGKRVGFTLNHEVVRVDEDGVEWTEVKVVIFIFESVAHGVSYKTVARILNEKGIPTPYVSKGMKRKGMIGTPMWLVSNIHKIIRQSAYIGEYRCFRTVNLFGEKIPGKKGTPRRKTSVSEQIIVAVPAIITRELAEEAQARAKRNKDVATRNNHHPRHALLRAGLVKCGECGGNLTASGHYRKLSNGDITIDVNYQCRRAHMATGRCEGCQIAAHLVDIPAWECAVAIIKDPGELDRRVNALLKDKSFQASQERQKTMKALTDIRRKQTNFRKQLSDLMQEGKLDKGTREYLNGQLQVLTQQEEDARKELADEEAVQKRYQKLQQKIVEFHKRCEEWREILDDPQFTPPYQFKRDACEYFGITAIVYRNGHKPRFEIYPNPPSIVSLLS
jgi:DNA invertase Pin-like site-specific DNA recombinase